MKICKTTKNDINALVGYQCKMFPDRDAALSTAYMQLWFSRGDDAQASFVIAGDDKRIHGQDLFSSMSYHYAGEWRTAMWEFDLIVDELLRRETWGIDLLFTALNEHGRVFSTGANDNALKIHRKMGKQLLGELRKYVKVVNPLYFATGVFRGQVASEKFPQEVSASGAYERVAPDNFPDIKSPFNPDLMEFGRDNEYLRWRFTQLHDYAVYRKRGGDVYFVCRTIVRQHITALVMVDYRCDVNHDFEDIIIAVTKIAKKLRLPMLITSSSLATTDAVLDARGFKSVGRPRPILGMDERLKDKTAEIESRNLCLVTLADSDGEVMW